MAETNGITEDMVHRGLAANLKRCSSDGAHYTRFTLLMGMAPESTLESADAEFNALTTGNPLQSHRTCHEPLRICADQLMALHAEQGKPVWNKLIAVLDLKGDDLTVKTTFDDLVR